MKNHLLFLTTLFTIITTLCNAQTSPTLWGLTSSGGIDDEGTLFQTNTTGSAFRNDYSFIGPGYGNKNLMQASNGLIYGMNVIGGTYNRGILFSYDTLTSTETVLHNFGSTGDGFSPLGTVLQVGNLLYGTTLIGGTHGDGILFSYDISSGAYTDLYNFGSGTDGQEPASSLLLASNGLIYGVTGDGGVNGEGTIFSYDDTTGVETDIHDFGSGTDGQYPGEGALIQVTDSLLYGLTGGGGVYTYGTIFSYNINTGTETDLADFDGTNGDDPYASLIKAGNGLLYGTTVYGGAYSEGNIFSYNINTATETDIHDFGIGTDGYYPNCTLIQASDSSLYGVTVGGGANYAGMIFSYDISSTTESDVYDFTKNSNGKNSLVWGGLIQASSGLLYGYNIIGGANNTGELFSYHISNSIETDVYDFSYIIDGLNPQGTVMVANNGLFYGTTLSGGTHDSGTIFRYNFSTGEDKIIYNFGGGTDGQSPDGALIQATNGLLYGTTTYGGAYGLGTIFSFDINTGAETVLHNFGNGTDGQRPFYISSLIQASNGLLYGVTGYGGANSLGILFSFDITNGKETDLYDFAGIGSTDGSYPGGALLQQGNLLYGTTAMGGTLNGGTIFSYDTTTGKETNLHSFTGNDTDGVSPYGSLILANDGLLYGMTLGGGAYESVGTYFGTIFSFNTATGREKDIHDFSGYPSDGSQPYGSLMQASDSLLYAMTSDGGTNNYGTVFSFNIKTATDSVIYNLTYAGGVYPFGNLIEDDTTAEAEGIKQLPVNNNTNLLIYPNPTSGQFTIKLNGNQNGYTIEIYNIMGERVYQSIVGTLPSPLLGGEGQGVRFINLTSQPAGMYFIYLKSQEGVVVGKVLVTK